MKKNEYTFTVELSLSAPVNSHSFLLRCVPAESDTLRVLSEEVTVDPPCSLFRGTDGFGNVCLTGSLEAMHDRFVYASRGTVLVDQAARRPASPAEALRYRFSGRMTEPSAEMEALVRALRPGIAALPAAEAMTAVMEALRERMEYCPGETDSHTTAGEALRKGRGVCQDYANIYAALCRRLGFSSRYCMGLACLEGSTHAWAEVLLPDGWHGIDPTRGCLADDSYVRLAVGRDSADCPAECGVMRGFAFQTQRVYTTVRSLGETAQSG